MLYNLVGAVRTSLACQVMVAAQGRGSPQEIGLKRIQGKGRLSIRSACRLKEGEDKFRSRLAYP